MEILDESVASSRRICHDIRHHNTVIAEFAQRGQYTELLQYLKEYEKITNIGVNKFICANTAVNNILSAYTRKAEKENIKAKSKSEESSLEVQLYNLKYRVNQLFFSILLLDEQLSQNDLYAQDLERTYNIVKQSVKNGVANSSDLDAVEIGRAHV